MTRIFSVELPITKVFSATRRLRKLGESGDNFTQRANLFVAATLFTLSFLSYGIDVFLAKDNEGVTVFCYCPAEFPDSRVHYTNYVCFTQGFYYVPFDEELPVRNIRRDKDIKERTFNYYPWVNHILILQAVLFCIPRVLWRIGGAREGFQHAVCLDALNYDMFERKNDDDDGRKINEDAMTRIENYVRRYINLRESVIYHTDITSLLPSGYRYTVLFIVTEFLMVFNSISQFYLLQFLLGIDFINFGIDYLSNMPNILMAETNRFPREAFCDLTVRQQINVQTYTVQCSLPSNMINEKIFLLVWVMLFCVSVLNIVSLAYQVTSIKGMRSKAIEEINSYQLRKSFQTESTRSMMNVNRFVCECLKLDILLFLWQLKQSHKPIIYDVMFRLWDRYSHKEDGEAPEKSEPESKDSHISYHSTI